jgi:hypothetical protein
MGRDLMALIIHRSLDKGGEVCDGGTSTWFGTVARGGSNRAARAFSALVAAVPIMWSTVALIHLDTNAGLDAVPVTVAGLSFTPAVAIASVLLGLIALAAGTADDRASKLGIGALLSCIGIAVLLAGTARTDLDLQAGHGWLSLAVGLVLVGVGVAVDVVDVVDVADDRCPGDLERSAPR